MSSYETPPPDQLTETAENRFDVRKRTLSAALSVMIAGTYGWLMYAEHDPNPLRVATNVTRTVGSKLGVDYCPDAPDSATQKTIVDEISNAKFLSEEQILEANNIDPGDLFVTSALIDKATTPQAATSVLSDFTSRNMGFETKLDIPEAILAAGFNLDAYKQKLNTFASYTSLLPNALLRKIDIPKVTFNRIFEDSNYHFAALYEKKDTPRPSIYMDINVIQDVGIFIHEALGHGGQYEACNGVATIDRAMTNLNPKGFSYDITCGKPLRFPEAVASYRSGANSSEDEAEQARFFAVEGASADEQIQASTTLGRKLLLILSRWDAIAPGSPALMANARAYLKIIDAESTDTPSYTPSTPPHVEVPGPDCVP